MCFIAFQDAHLNYFEKMQCMQHRHATAYEDKKWDARKNARKQELKIVFVFLTIHIKRGRSLSNYYFPSNTAYNSKKENISVVVATLLLESIPPSYA